MNEEISKKVIAIRRKIHENPELGNHEFKTAALIEKVLNELEISHERVTPTGVVALLSRGNFSRCVALRADMDALPLLERSKQTYRSKVSGAMHACGHDAHVAMALGAAMILTRDRDWQGKVKFLFQPNEEGAGGAKDLIAAGSLKNPKVEAIFGLHVNPRLPAGTFGIKAGALMASVDKFEVEILGMGGHAAYPHEGKDAIPVAAEMVSALQTIVSRRIDPLEPVVVTVGTIQGGTRYNILAEKVVLTGTVRTLSEKTHSQIPKIMKGILSHVAQAHGTRIQFQFETIGSVLTNPSEMTEVARSEAIQLFGQKNVVELNRASMGGEDFSDYLKLIPGCFIYLGVGNKSKRSPVPWHHPEFDLEESALIRGSQLLAALSRRTLAIQPDFCIRK